MSKIIQANILEESKKDLQRYSIKVNRARMIPDMRDGLKPVHRRILDIMYNHLPCTNHTLKSARIVGAVLGISHPHGDTSVYDAMKGMVNDFEIKIPLIDGQGNFGTIQGDEQAAMRYTEAKLSRYSVDYIIGELKESKNIVDWIPTYDNKNKEPEYFPVKVPNLLINGAFGIGYGIKTDIPKHNVRDVVDATISLINNPDAEIVLKPDHCMPVHIVDTNFKAICNKGRGSYTARGIIDIESDNSRNYLIIKSTPDLVFLNSVIYKLNKMIENHSLPVDRMSEEDSPDSKLFRYVLRLSKGAEPNYCRELIYARTDMQKRYTVNFEVLHKLEPIRMSYKSYLQSFIEFRKVTKFRLYCNMLQEVETKYHEKEAFVKLLESKEINNIIKMLQDRTTTDDGELIEYLISVLDITDLQATYILNANLKKLSMGYLKVYTEEASKFLELRDQYMNKIIKEELLVEEIINELKEFRTKYGQQRTSKIISSKSMNDIPEGNFKIIITNNNFIKKLPVEFPNGRFKDDYPKFIINGSNTQAILLFDDMGRVFRLPIHRIFISDKNSNGIDVRTIIKGCTANIIKVMYEPIIEELSKKTTKYYITTVTNKGLIKKMDLEDFLNVPMSGILYVKLDDDLVRSVNIYNEKFDIIVYGRDEALRINMNEIPHQRRNTKGVKTMVSDHVDGMSMILPNSKELLVLTNKGYINKFDIIGLPLTGRNKTSAKIIQLVRGDSINTIHSILKDNTTFKVMTVNDTMEFPLEEIKLNSSISKGNKLIPLKGDNIISSKIQ